MKLYSLKDGLKRARKEAGLTQAELAEKLSDLGIVGHIKTVMNWEQGKSEPSLKTLMELADFYNCDLDYLTGRIDCKTHDIQFIHDQTGLSEKAIRKLQDFITPPDYEKLEEDLREAGVPDQKIPDLIEHEKNRFMNSIARDYPEILSLLIEDLDSEYLISLISRRVKDYGKRSSSQTNSTQDDLWIEIDGQRIMTQKRNILDSLIQSEVASMIPVIAENYHSSNSEQ